VIAAASISAAVAAKAATTTIPVVFIVGDDPVRLGLVASLARPGGNLTGTNFFSVELAAKRLELLRELAPAATRIAVLVNPANPANAELTIRDVGTAANTMGSHIQILNAGSSREIDAAFASLAHGRSDALYVSTGPPFTDRRVQLALLAARSGLPAIYGARNFAEAGGLMSYGASLGEAYRQAGVYTGRILKGAKPADLPVQAPTKYDLAINLKAATAIGIEFPTTVIARADEVIE
jgi:putative tryptophan/tyrosine transport system substrate-binding protein